MQLLFYGIEITAFYEVINGFTMDKKEQNFIDLFFALLLAFLMPRTLRYADNSQNVNVRKV
jgi:hypothetical protein